VEGAPKECMKGGSSGDQRISIVYIRTWPSPCHSPSVTGLTAATRGRGEMWDVTVGEYDEIMVRMWEGWQQRWGEGRRLAGVKLKWFSFYLCWLFVCEYVHSGRFGNSRGETAVVLDMGLVEVSIFRLTYCTLRQ